MLAVLVRLLISNAPHEIGDRTMTYQEILDLVKFNMRDSVLLQRPCSSEQIAYLFSRSQEELLFDIPNAYVDFLMRMNGLAVDQLTIFGCEDISSVQHLGQTLIPGFIEENLGLRKDINLYQDFIVFAKSDLDYYAYNLGAGQYQCISNGCLDTMDVFLSAEDMFVNALNTYVLNGPE